jgi:hypothetical protein
MRRAHIQSTVFALTALIAYASGCDDKPSPALKGQVNTTISFHGLTVDQDGRPLPGVRVEYQVEAYPKDWTFETRGKPYDVMSVAATTGEDGRFNFKVTGRGLRLKRVVAPPGFRHLFEQSGGNDHGVQRPYTFGYTLIAWGDLWYKTDADHPAVYVFVKDGVTEVAALPCRGGWDSGGGKRWTQNTPAWPKHPSLADVVYVGPATRMAADGGG